eukprot:CAMPEP_0113838602 /NCGR_PEP_ID=MMETSP0328-20130328/10629_1 /TAXON_ID=39455 /ORGANISM="Alexandrium minutum" /LENGTH=50 /DNA_ID=CAMNT_0000807151 /DNA_START=95 /DNA_END=243 /DNA_ORIENTATION=+ /assembly_acc=CAM_ASM_000350
MVLDSIAAASPHARLPKSNATKALITRGSPKASMMDAAAIRATAVVYVDG